MIKATRFDSEVALHICIALQLDPRFAQETHYNQDLIGILQPPSP